MASLWIQDILSEGVISLETVGTHHNPSDVLTKFVQAAVLGQHLPKLNLFKASLSEVHKYCSGVEKIKAVKLVKEDVCNRAHAVLSKVYQQVRFNIKAIQSDVRFVCWISILFRISRRFSPKDSEKRSSESG